MKKKDAAEKVAEKSEGERIAKYLARAGIASRRDCEAMIAQGRIKLNGAVVTHPATFVKASDAIEVDNKAVARKEPSRLWRYHKPEGVLTSARDPQGRPTLFAQLPKSMPRVVSVGRLDFNSEGLLLLTNDGALARYLELPKHALIRRYRARVHCGAAGIADDKIKKLAKGITIQGIHYQGVEVKLTQQTGHNAWLDVALKEGKNREIRKIMEHMGWPVSRLIRVAFGPFQLGKLEKGEVEEIPARVVREQLKPFFDGAA